MQILLWADKPKFFAYDLPPVAMAGKVDLVPNPAQLSGTSPPIAVDTEK